MRDWMMLDEPGALKALAHPLRMELLRLLTQGKASVQELAGRLGLAHAKVYYHVKELEKNGLVRVVDTAVINGIVEKFYQAVAKTFFVGQALGHHTDVSETAQEAVAMDLLERRRQEVLKIDYQRLAERLVRQQLNITPGSKVLLEGSPTQRDLLETIAVECRRVGAEGIICYFTAQFLRDLMLNVDTKILEEVPPFSAELYRTADYIVSVGTLERLDLFKDIPVERIEAWRMGGIKAFEPARSTLRSVTVAWPSLEWAKERGVAYTVLYDAFWRALDIDEDRLRTMGEELARCIRDRETVEFENESGTCLKLRLAADRPIYINDGTLQDFREDFDTDLILPGGKLLFAPVEESVNGRVIVPRFELRGELLRNIILEIEEGRIVRLDAGTYTQTLKQALSGNKGGFRVGSISIGFNPGVSELTGFEPLDLIKPHTVGIGLGANSHLGGTIEDSIPLFFAVPCNPIDSQ